MDDREHIRLANDTIKVYCPLLKEEIEDAIDFNIEEQKKMISGEKTDVIIDKELQDNYVEDESEENSDEDFEENEYFEDDTYEDFDEEE